jgi:hypothetical protein
LADIKIKRKGVAWNGGEGNGKNEKRWNGMYVGIGMDTNGKGIAWNGVEWNKMGWRRRG